MSAANTCLPRLRRSAYVAAAPTPNLTDYMPHCTMTFPGMCSDRERIGESAAALPLDQNMDDAGIDDVDLRMSLAINLEALATIDLALAAIKLGCPPTGWSSERASSCRTSDSLSHPARTVRFSGVASTPRP